MLYSGLMDFPQGQIGQYRIIRPLGKGGMGEVYEVENTKLGARYALKVFTLDHGDVEFLRKRFRVEGRLLARLAHPRIVRVYDMDVDEATGLPYYVMDLVLDPSGNPCTLRTLSETGGITEEQVAGWYEDLRAGLDYIHGAGVVHRDVTLDNVLIGSDGHAVLSDFGVSKILPRDLRAELQETLHTMVDGGKPVMGKPFYLAPELAKGAEESAASDYYSLGVLLVRLLTQVWYTPGASLGDMLAPFDPTWAKVVPPLLAEDPAKRRLTPWESKWTDRMRIVSGEKRASEVTLRIRFPHWVIAAILVCFGVAFVAVALLAAMEHGLRRASEHEVQRLSEIIRTLQQGQAQP